MRVCHVWNIYPRTHSFNGMMGCKNFRFDFLSSLKYLCDCDVRFKDELSYFLQVESWSSDDKQLLLQKLAEVFLIQDLTPFLVKHCKPILLEILERCAQNLQQESYRNGSRVERFCYTLSELLTLSHLKDFVYRFIKTCSLFSIISDEEQVNEQEIERILCVLKTCYNLLSYDFETFHRIWEWSPIFKFLQHSHPGVRWYALHIISILTGISEQIKIGLLDKLFTISERTSFLTQEFTRKLLSHVRDCRDINDHQKLTSDSMDVSGDNINGASINKEDLSGQYTTLCGVILPCLPGTLNLVDHSFVMVPSTVYNLHLLVLSVATGNGVLLEGPIGCGKTALVEFVARATGRTRPPEFMKIQLGDQTDSKSLLGTYVCTDTPGEFVWQAGPLLQAVQAGYWILLEDIDLAPMDVISVLIPLLESRTLSVPAHGNVVKASPEFQLFGTQRSYSGHCGFSYHVASANSAILEKLWSRVQIEPFSKEELTEVVVQKYPDLENIATKLVDIYCMLSADPHLVSSEDTAKCSLPYDKRQSSSRDLMKWCSRIAVTACGAPTLLDSKEVFLEAHDCFSAPLPKTYDQNLIDLAVGAKLGLTKEKIEFFFMNYKPNVHTSPLSMTVGRVTLKKKVHESLAICFGQNNLSKFAHTRHSLVLLEKVAACIRNSEPVLLVGETGTGKTSTVQYLATQCAVSLKVVNMSQQSDSSDLLGGYKPVEMKQIVAPVREKFEMLFCKTFSRKQNVKFLSHVQRCFAQQQWEILFKLMIHSQKNATERVKKDKQMEKLLVEWQGLIQDIQQLQKQQKNAESALAFRFVEGTLVQALQNGDWVLLDEINLATPETLECLCSLLESSSGSVVLMERGDVTPTVRHEDFRLFACMNPATDVGKKDLPPGIRNRFTEIFVRELESTADLKTLVVDYLQGLSPNSAIVDGIVRFYLTVKHEAEEKLTDGTGHKPHYSLRTLCRALRYAAINPHQNVLRSIYEGFCLSFLTQLDRSSHPSVQSLIKHHILGHVNAASMLKQPLPKPQDSGHYHNFEGFWIALGSKEPVMSNEYVLTASVKANLKDLARVVSARKLPVLIQGETSVGKTSLIQWLAKASGNHCVRINNHEHTDIQEYLGCYTSDENGKLVFKEGVLVDAMRKGHWIILDELNLAPSDVLEALNRLLDDNRELFIPETQETVVAHPMFMLFATQNPPGHYGGRKVLSRAFRNRFVELHFDELPSQELEVILHQRCRLPLSYAKKLVAIMLALQARRRSTNVFAGKQGFITLRDLFRWAERYSKTPDVEGSGFYDWDQHIAEDGYMLLAGRCRNPSECKVIQEVIEKQMKRSFDPDSLFGYPSLQKHSHRISSLMEEVTTVPLEGFKHIVWTYSMRRLAVLAGRALKFGEPVLLVGETGCGKTTICQLFAALWKQQLFAVNCHMHSESADFLGGLRPVRHRGQEEQDEQVTKLFEWCDGPLVQAMKDGAMFLVDEISLADDSVLERLNSVLEPERTLVLAEKGSDGGDPVGEDVAMLVAHEDFKIIGTMNPGGDFGKKELSPALRNRFTEIWCPPSDARADLIQIIEHNIKPGVVLKSACQGTSGIGEAMVDFIEWFHSSDFGKRFVVSIRDLLSWVNFINTCSFSTTLNGADENTGDKVLLSSALAYVHGACLVFLDALGAGSNILVSSSLSSSATITSATSSGVKDAYQACLEFLKRQVEQDEEEMQCCGYPNNAQMKNINERPDFFGIWPFYIQRGPQPLPEDFGSTYTLSSPTTSQNAQCILRALQLPRPILLEGSPGVGKTSLVHAIAKASGHELIRINLSEQTDVTDLFGSDLPVEGGEAGQFVWRDGPLLKALKAGSWIVLDELNLASQSVLEGLNACLDHRAEVYIPELGMTFKVQPDQTRLFACQNPLNQGGGRKGLPKSFLNRFTQVYVELLSKADLLFITQALYPQIDQHILEKMVTFNQQIHEETVVEGNWGRKGGPWELNLRDVFRWCDLLIKYQNCDTWNPGQFVHLIYCDRMRTLQDKQMVLKLFKSIFENSREIDKIGPVQKSFYVTPGYVQVGHSWLPRCSLMNQSPNGERPLQLLHHCLPAMESLITCLDMNWMAVLVGPRSCGKTSLVHLVAQLTGNRLEVMAMNSAMDTTELLGGFEQADLDRHLRDIIDETKRLIPTIIKEILICNDQMSTCLQEISSLYKLWSSFSSNNSEVSEDENAAMLSHKRLDDLKHLLTKVQEICSSYEFDSSDAVNIMEMVQSLQKKLRANKDSSHCGGQFEWVDGQLVEALKSGYWLLIDNVNFCSPSVLDRLNALLEPGGVLTIDERGVIDGQIPSIKPHPNFRLILAMDPRYGEISRAMRNRGVEIFMLGEEDDEKYDDCDYQMMLNGLGIEDKRICDCLVAFHTEKGGSFLDMLHAASLTKQLLQGGSEELSAVATSLNQVYARNQTSVQNKQDVKDLIGKHTKNLGSAVHFESTILHFPSAQEYHANSVVSTIKQQSLPLLHILQNGTSVHQVESAVLLFLERASHYDWTSRLGYLQSVVDVLCAKKLCSCHLGDVASLLKSYLKSFGVIYSSQLMDKLRIGFNDIQSTRFDFRMLEHLPYDLRQNTDLFNHLRQFPVNTAPLERASGLANRLSLLEAKARQCYSFEEKIHSSGTLQSGNLIQLCNAFHAGQLPLESLPHPVVVHMLPFFKLLGSVMDSCIHQGETFSDSNYWMVVEGLTWLDRLWTMCEKQTRHNFSLSFLSLHWTWVEQYTLHSVQTAFGKFTDRELPEELVTVVNHLQTVLATDRRVTEAYLRILVAFGHPAPFKSRSAFMVWEKTQSLCERFDNYCNRSWNRRFEEEQQSCKNAELKGKLAEVLKIMLDNTMNLSEEEYSQCDSILSSVEETTSRNLESTQEIMTSDDNSSEPDQETSVNIRMNDVALKKIMSLMFGDVCSLQEGRVLGSLMLALVNQMARGATSLDSGAVRDEIEALTTYHLKKRIRDPVIQAIFCHLGGTLSKGNNLNSHFSSIFRLVESEILTECFMLESRKLWVQGNEGKESNVFSVLGGARHLLDSVSSRKLVEEGHGSSLTSLTICNYDENLKHLEILSSHFWVNGDLLNSHNEVDRNSSIKLFIAKWFQVLLSVKESLFQSRDMGIASVINRILPSVYEEDSLLRGINSVVDVLKEVVQIVANAYKHCTGNVKQADSMCNLLTACLEGVSRLPEEARADDTDMFWDSICLGDIWTKLGLVQSLILSPVGPVDPVEKTRIELEYVNSEIQRIEEELKVRYYAEEIWRGVKTSVDDLEALVCDEHRSESQLTSNPVRVGRLLTKLKNLRVKAENLSKNAAIRPDISQFDAILDEVKHFLHTVGEINTVTDLTTSMRELASQLYDSLKKGVNGNVLANSVTSAVHKAKAWYTSVERVIQKLRKDYPLYCDILGPFIAGVSQVMYGVSLMSSNLSTLFQYYLFRAQLTMGTNMQCSGPDVILSFCEFPLSSSLSCLDAAVSLMSPSVDACIQGLVKYLQVRETAARTSAFLSFRALRLSVLHLRNHSIQHGFLDEKLYQAVITILEIFLNKWKIFKEEERQREEEEGSLFKFKNKTHGVSLSDDEENKRAISKTFPRFDDDFKDFMAPQDLNENTFVPQDENASSTCVVKSDAELFMENVPDFSELRRLHEETFCRLRPSRDFALHEADCYRPNDSMESLYLEAFKWGYETASVMNALIPWLHADMKTSRSHLLQSSFLKGQFQSDRTVKQEMLYQKGLSDKKPFDIYHDSNIQEVVRVKPILADFAARVHELLAEWPRHPALMQLLVVIERILSFPVTSPVMKILTGLEVLLRKAQDWESNAAKHVSLRDHLDNVTHLIIQWRKMELKCWSTLLDVTTLNSAAKASQWWFHVYSSLVQFRMTEYAQEPREVFPDGSEVIEPLQRFIESSTLGEFASRLQMLFAFYKQMCYEEASTGEVKVSDVLWNLFCYYKQFIPSVEQSLQEMRKPIEKDLKDFVKIAKWNDSNFWAMKQAADKSHHTLHKFVRRYEASLNEPVSKTLKNVEKALSPSEDKGNYTNERKNVQVEWFISSEALKAHCNRSLQFISTHEKWRLCLPSNQNRLTKLFQKMRQLSHQIISRQEYEPLVTCLDDFTAEVITTSKELQALDVSSQPKEKQTDLRKHIQQRKRKSLSDLFKILALLGVSYRKGLNLERQSTGKEAMLVAAVEEEAVTRSVELLSDRSPDLLHNVRQLLEGCCRYYYKSLARSSALTGAMVTPSKELSVGDIDRCKGCSNHLLHVCYEQRQVISQLSRNIRRTSVGLRQLRESVTSPDEDVTSGIASLPSQKDLEKHTIQVMDLLTNTAHVLQQMSILLKCCPNEKTPLHNWTPLPQAMLSSVAVSSAEDPDIKEMIQTLENTVTRLHQVANEVRPYAALSDHVLNNTSGNDRTATIASWLQSRVTRDAFFKLKGTADLIDEMLPKFKSKCCSVNKGLGGPLVRLKDKILEKFNDFHSWSTAVSGKGEIQTPWSDENIDDQGVATLSAFISDVDALNTSLLLAVQRLAKVTENSTQERNEEVEDSKKNTADQDGSENLQLQDGHLATRLHQNLLNDISRLKLNDVTKSVSSLLSQVKSMTDSSWSSSNMSVQFSLSGFCAHLLEGSIPLLHQYLNLSQNLLINLLEAHRATSKLLSVLLSIFTDLGTRGFCVPPEIEEGEGDGSTEFEDIEGGGIGDGEGMKDVSDQIENEDQLEDAKQEGLDQEKKEDDSQQQIPDEENGIEMSENFEGALHDLEAGKEEDEENEEGNGDEDDVDKQMGEVDGQDTEKLDEKIWGDSDDEEEKEEHEMKEEKGTGAEAESQSQLVAKEDNKGSTDERKEQTEGQPDADEEQSDENINGALQGEEGNLSDEGEDEQEGTGQQGKEEEPVDAEESSKLELPDDLQLDDEGNEGEGDQPEEMETEEFEGDQIDTEETGDKTTAPDDEQIDTSNDEEEGEELVDEEEMEGTEGDEKKDVGEGPEQDEDAIDETDQEEWRTKTDTEPQENVQAVEDSGEGDGNGEQSDVTAGQSESTEGNEERGVGRAEALDDGHLGESSQRIAQTTTDARQQSRQRKQMNLARSDRALGSMDETTHKRLKTVDETELEPGAEVNETRTEDLFQHMRNDDPSSHDAQTLDSATADQAETQDKANFPEMHSDGEDDEGDSKTETALLYDNEELPTPDKSQPSRLPPPMKPKLTADNEDGNEARESEAVEEAMETNDDEGMTAERLRSTFHSSDMALAFGRLDISSLDPEKVRADLEHQLAEWSSMDRGTAEQQQMSQEAWRKYELLTSNLSQDLCEQLRLVLEPSLATKLKGDYRSGKRLNMRKVIPYIASQFRKDKIWLRRTKPSKRQYQIMLAVDDSSSMNDNRSKQLAFESLAVISNALTRLEAGDLGVCSFGETVCLLHPFHEPFTDNSGARILQQFTFDQKKTKIAELLSTCTSLMVASHSRLQVSPRTRKETSQLLLIVSDGRGIFLEGMETVQKAVRLARETDIFMVFVILDNPANKDSVLDIRVPIFRPGKLPEIKSYMEQFPFPFYIILRDINALPMTLSDALRQWFELVSSFD